MILCQKCAAVNQFGQEVCSKCGTRLMITAPQYEQERPSVQPLEEHLLERISTLEYEHTKLGERMAQLTEIVNKLVSGNFYDHKMIEAISDALQKARVVAGKTLENLWRERVLDYREESARREHFAARKPRIVQLCPEKHRPRVKTKLNHVESLLFGAGNSKEGVRLLRGLMRTVPKNYELAFLLSEYFYSINRFTEAAQYLQKALTVNPQHFDSILLWGVMLTNSGRYAEAEDVLRTAVGLRADSHIAHLTLGAVCASQGQPQKAKQHLSKAVGLAPSSSMYFTAGEISANFGWQKDAIHFYKKAIQIDPTFDEAFYKLGLIYLKNHRTRAAEKYLRTAYQLNPQESRYREALKAHTKRQARQNS
ncbi:MAG: tetratricopeptide repeat protein [Terriglobia bacterium]|jgi:tetratricopeptide (TPR) repeat protein